MTLEFENTSETRDEIRNEIENKTESFQSKSARKGLLFSSEYFSTFSIFFHF